MQPIPLITAGADAAQRGRTQVKSASAITATVVEAKPTRMASMVTYSIEDAMRTPGLVDAIRPDMGLAVTTQMDKAIFEGDATANENATAITGLTTLSLGTDGSLSQTNKVKADNTVALFHDYVHGIHAYS